MGIFQVQARQGGSPLLDAIQGGLATADKIYGLKAQQAQMDRGKLEAERADAEHQRTQALRAEEEDPGSPMAAYVREQAKGVGIKLPEDQSVSQYRRTPGLLEHIQMLQKAKEERRGEAAKRAGKEESSGVVVPGFSVVPGAKPTKEDASAIKGMNESKIKIEKSLARLKQLVNGENGEQGAGGELFPGPIKDEMESITSSLMLDLKDAAKLGQITESDMALIQAQVPVTTGWGAKFAGGERLNKRMDNFSNLVRDKLTAATKARGFAPIEESQKTAGGPPGQRIIEGTPDPATKAAAQQKIQERMAARKGQSNPIVKR